MSPLPKRILIVAGGTGGHLYPGIAVAHELQKAAVSVQFVVRRGDLGREVLAREGFAVTEITGSGLPRSLGISTLKFPASLWQSVREANHLIQQEKPDAVLGMGGYLSFSVLWAAQRAKIPTLIHEQNVVPGLANRLLARIVDSIAVSFPESVKGFPSEKVWISGLPVRSSIVPDDPTSARRLLGLAENCPTFLLFGGSLGARHLNTVFMEVWRRLKQAQKVFQVFHITGPKDFDAVEPHFLNDAIPGRVVAYCHEMDRAYAAASLVICRSGASTIAELLAAQRRAILIPYPHATGDHQWFNAQLLVQRGFAEAFREEQLTADSMADRLIRYLDAPTPEPCLGQTTQMAQTPSGYLVSYLLTKVQR